MPAVGLEVSLCPAHIVTIYMQLCASIGHRPVREHVSLVTELASFQGSVLELALGKWDGRHQKVFPVRVDYTEGGDMQAA